MDSIPEMDLSIEVLAGHPGVYQILPQLGLSDLVTLALTNRALAELCRREETWIIASRMRFPDLIQFKPSDLDWKRYYWELVWATTTHLW